MTIEVKVPVLPESVSDATIATWHKKKGDKVLRDENIVDLETDKVVMEVPSPVDGVITEIIEVEGAIVEAKQLLAKITEGTAAEPENDSAETKPNTEEKNEVVETTKAAATSPAVRRMMFEQDVDAEDVSGSGKAGRITKNDVAQHLSVGSRDEKRVPMSRLRAKIAERLVSGQQNAAVLTTFNEVNLKAIKELRVQYKDSFEKKHGVKLGFMSFFTKAVVESLKNFPSVNASIDGQDIVYHGFFDIGIAVSTERGLVVPVVRDADKLSMAGIENKINDCATRARKGKLSLEEMQGGTFTITNGGVFGSLLATPIINPPQTAILGMNKIEDRPVVENGEIVIRPMMYLALSYDHRLIDGKESVQFLVSVKQLLEDPARLLLNV